jgi:MFS family permease
MVDIHTLTALSLMQGVLDGAHMPVRMSVVPNLVTKKQLQSAIALTSISFNVSRFVGPAFAGIIIVKFGIAAAFFANGISYLSLIAAMLVIRLNPASDRKRAQKHPWLELKDGVRYVLHHESIRAVLIIIALASVFGRGALEMMPAFADAVYQRGSAGLAILTSAIGAGAIATGLVLSRGTTWLNVNVVRTAAGSGGILTAALGLPLHFNVAVAIVTSIGIVLSICGVGSQILIQTLVDDGVRGRVSSIWGMVAFGGTAIGGLLVGSAASLWGLQNSVMVAGILCSVAVALSAKLAKQSVALD